MVKINKRKVRYICVSVIILLILLPMYFTTGQFGLIGDKAKIQRNVVEYLRVQHGWANEQRLEAITTETYYNYICKNGINKRTFVYTINKRFMKTYNQVSDSTGIVTVELYEPDVIFCIFSFKRVGDSYLISNVQYDK